ncbi:hypothetical protein LTS10_013300 [Elasticomyces elasticus]|nr:hypothetical protein LTS10_013300 [Elasticomyces elasticus]
MAAGVDFIPFDSDMDTSSTEDVVTEWNTELQSSRGDDVLGHDIYYWMGKKYFICVLAQHIASTTSTLTTLIDMDSKVQAAQRHYPFTDHFRLMQDQAGLTLPSDSDHTFSGDYEALMVHIGRIVVGGSRRSKKMMVQSLRRFCGEQISHHAQSVTSGRQGSFPVSRPVISRSDTPADGYGGPTLAQFAVALKEKGDAMGTCPQYEVTTLRQYPALFRATVSLQGRSFDGEGSTKKQARHEAAKEACRDMGVVPA